MSEARLNCLNQLKAVSNANVILVTPDNLTEFVAKKEPLHPAYEFLSETHRSDYLRCYFMHHFGGGYSDIKETPQSWSPAFNLLNSSSDLWTIGYQEPSSQHLKFPPGSNLEEEYRRNWRFFIGNGAFIYKAQTPITQEWYEQVNNLLDENLEALNDFPAQHPQDKWKRKSSNLILRTLRLGRSRYPLRWEQLMGEIHHPLSYKYRMHIKRTLPAPSTFNYR
ncbi:hypothetical protein [Agarivorans sp. Alg241-V36]|uniref:hypothetical protein n=1 Tax=Agarivorans sp. Alg241-V36 TaxID=2305992 RepID=UPI0013D8B648|nr:hypothetical protein [Agarivorans sp. Alg241-V36]